MGVTSGCQLVPLTMTLNGAEGLVCGWLRDWGWSCVELLLMNAFGCFTEGSSLQEELLLLEAGVDDSK